MGHAHAKQIGPPRFPFAAELRATELNSGSEIWGETTSLSKGGCYVRASQSFPEGTLLLVEIRAHGMSFTTDAKVAYGFEGDGMGLAFVNIPASQLPILEHWLSSPGGKGPGEALRRPIE